LANSWYSCYTADELGGLRVHSRVTLLEGGKWITKSLLTAMRVVSLGWLTVQAL